MAKARRPTRAELDQGQRDQDALRALGTAPEPSILGEPRIEFTESGISYEVTDYLPNGRPFSYRALVDGSDAGPIVTGIVISGPAGIDSAVLRAIKPAEIVRVVGSAAQRVARQWVETLDTPQGQAARDALAELDARTPRRGRPRLNDDFLRGVAEEYLKTQEELSGTRSSVIATIAERRFVESVKTVEMWVRRAAASGFLSPAVRGRAGRLPGPRFHETPIDEERR